MALVIPGKSLCRVDLEEKSNIVMAMGGLGVPRGDLMDIDIEDGARNELRRRNTDLLGDFAGRDGPDIRIAVAVPAWLEPEVKFAVMHQEDLAAIGRQHEAGCRNVICLSGAIESGAAASAKQRTDLCRAVLRPPVNGQESREILVELGQVICHCDCPKLFGRKQHLEMGAQAQGGISLFAQRLDCPVCEAGAPIGQGDRVRIVARGL